MTLRKREGTGNWKRKHQHTLRKTCFGTVYGPVKGQTTEWTNSALGQHWKVKAYVSTENMIHKQSSTVFCEIQGQRSDKILEGSPLPVNFSDCPFKWYKFELHTSLRNQNTAVSIFWDVTLLIGKWFLICWLNMTPSFSKVQDPFFKTLGATQHHIPKDCKPQSDHRENLKP